MQTQKNSIIFVFVLLTVKLVFSLTVEPKSYAAEQISKYKPNQASVAGNIFNNQKLNADDYRKDSVNVKTVSR